MVILAMCHNSEFQKILDSNYITIFEEYNDCVCQINALVSEALLHIKRAKSWRHRGLICPSAEIYLANGVHLNEGGHRALYKSYRGAILFALFQSWKYLSLH